MIKAVKRKNNRLVTVQWLIILALSVALTISITTRPAAAAVSPDPVTPIKPFPDILEPAFLPEGYTELGTFKTTAYCTCVKCCGVWSNEHPSRIGTDYVQKTASGTIPTAGRTIAVDKSVIAFGTVVIIDGKEYIAEDVGGAIKGNAIDIYFDSHEDARNYGVQYKTIYIKGE